MNAEQIKNRVSKNPFAVFIICLVLSFVIVLLVGIATRPPRSVAAFCSTYKQQDAILAKSYGDTYGVQPFTHSSNNPHDFVIALSKLNSVAPKQIEPDVKTLQQIFEKIDKDPSQAFSASLSGLGAEDDVQNWTTQNCK